MCELLYRRKKITEPEARYYIKQLINALQHLHSHLIIHRDLKLGNIFLSHDMKLKVGDFGLAAKLASPNEKRMTVCGTPNYIAPEQLEGKKGHSFPVDIWSTGVILYTLLIGKPPFQTKDVKSTYKLILSNSYSFPDNISISNEAKNLISLILQTDPSNRPKLEEILEHNFFKEFTPTSLSDIALKEIPAFDDSININTIYSKKDLNNEREIINDENDHHFANKMVKSKPVENNILKGSNHSTTTTLNNARPNRYASYSNNANNNSFTRPSSANSVNSTSTAQSTAQSINSVYDQHKPKILSNKYPQTSSDPFKKNNRGTFEIYDDNLNNNNDAIDSVNQLQLGVQQLKLMRSTSRPLENNDEIQSKPMKTLTTNTNINPSIQSGFKRSKEAWANSSGVSPLTKIANHNNSKVEDSPDGMQNKTEVETKFKRVSSLPNVSQRVPPLVSKDEYDSPTCKSQALSTPDNMKSFPPKKSNENTNNSSSYSQPQESLQYNSLNNPSNPYTSSSASNGFFTPQEHLIRNEKLIEKPIDTLEAMQEMLNKNNFSFGDKNSSNHHSKSSSYSVTSPNDLYNRMSADNKNALSPTNIHQFNNSFNEDLDINTDLPLSSLSSANAKNLFSVWIVRHVDYTSKYGMGYLLNNGSVGVFFNDSTKIVCSPKCDVFMYIERKSKKDDQSTQSDSSNFKKYLIDNYPAELNKKVTLLKHFRSYLLDTNIPSESSSSSKKEYDRQNIFHREAFLQAVELTTNSATSFSSVSPSEDCYNYFNSIEMPYIKRWAHSNHSIIFRLSTKTVQVIFYDKTEILLTSKLPLIMYVNKLGERSEHVLHDIVKSGRNDIAARLKYTKDIMYRFISFQQGNTTQK